MWNENSALELLKSMPEKLSQEDLALLQGVLDADKYVISAANGRDMCGEFAPFCKICNKEGSTPCATAYVNMKRGEGLNYKFASECDDETIEEENGQSLELTDAVASSAAAEEAAMAELCASQDVLRLNKPQEVFKLDKPEEVLRIDKPEEVLKIKKPEEVPKIDKPEEVLKIEGESTVSQPQEEPKSKKIRIAIARRKKSQ